MNGTLEVTLKEVTITADSASKIYDATALTDNGYTSSGLAKGDTFASVTVTGSQTVVGTSANVPSAAKILDKDGNDVTASYKITYVNGTLEVTKKALTITASSDSKIYDATALTNDGYTNTALATGDTIESVTVTGSQTVVGTSANVPSAAKIVNANGEDVTASYEIVYVNGVLEVTKKALTITADSDSKIYDGAALTNDGYTSSALATGDTFASVTVTGTITNVGTTSNVASEAVILNAEGEDVTASYDITYVKGTLEITKRSVTLTSADDSKVYDGTALTNSTVTAEGFVAGEGASYDVTGTITYIGTVENKFTYTLNGGTLAGNYDITVVFGTLTVTPFTDKVTVTITENSGTYVYDGTEHTVNGYTVSIENPLYAEADFTFGGKASVSGTDAGTYEMELTASDFTNINKNFTNVEFVIVDGTLEITKRPVTLTSADAEKKFDGTPITNATVTAEGFVTGEGATYTVTGTQTLIGSSANVFEYALNEGTKAENYDITVVEGTLTITPPDDFEIIEKTHEDKDIFRLGDEVTFIITVENPFDAKATVVVTEQEGVLIVDPTTGELAQSVTVEIEAGATITLEAVYTIQESDILQGDYTNTVTADITATVNEIPYDGEDDDDDHIDNIEDPEAFLRLTKTTVSTPANGSKYAEGETIKYQIKLVNEGNVTLTNIVINDVLSGELRSEDAVLTDPVNKTFALTVDLAPGEEYVIIYEHLVTEADLGKDLTNAVTGTAGNSTETDDDDDNDTTTDVTDDDVTDQTVDIIRGLSVEKSVIDKKDIYKLNTYIEYQIVVTNNGNVTERDVIVTDTITAADLDEFEFTDLNGGLLLANNQVLLPSIAPGQSVTLTCRYWITAQDEAALISNKVTVESDDGKHDDEDDSEVVKVEKLYDVTIYYFSDDWQIEMAPQFHGRYSVGNIYFIVSPVIEGYEANYKALGSGPDGMPEHDEVYYVLYTKLPDPTTEPTDPETEPTEPETDPTDPATEPTYDITEIPDGETPLGNVDLGDHSCCILHFLIMLVAMILLGFYTDDRKKRQAKIHELRRALEAEKAAKETV